MPAPQHSLRSASRLCQTCSPFLVENFYLTAKLSKPPRRVPGYPRRRNFARLPRPTRAGQVPADHRGLRRRSHLCSPAHFAASRLVADSRKWPVTRKLESRHFFWAKRANCDTSGLPDQVESKLLWIRMHSATFQFHDCFIIAACVVTNTRSQPRPLWPTKATKGPKDAMSFLFLSFSLHTPRQIFISSVSLRFRLSPFTTAPVALISLSLFNFPSPKQLVLLAFSRRSTTNNPT